MARKAFSVFFPPALGILCYLAGVKVRADEAVPRIVHHPADVVVKVGYPAILSCRADGNPTPSIEWLRNGQPLQTDSRDDQKQPITLSEGSLFFLSVGVGKKGQVHEGIYTCVAKNSVGTAVSRNASLYIAVLRELFNVEPSDVEVGEGEVAVLNCGPPRGHPEPNVIWKKDGQTINTTDHHYTELNGKLIISPAERIHSGAYMCVASNTAGVRESRAARLSVLAKPVLVLKPENVSVKMGESAHFFCQAKGDPPPAVVWSREQGPLPNGRYLVNIDQTLQIHYVTSEDAGKYTCKAVNDVGVVSATAQLTVEDAAITNQRDLHKELSAMRVTLESVAIMSPGSNMSQVQWKLQTLPAQPHYLDGFEVLYRPLLPASSDWAAKRVTPPSFEAQVGPLKRGYKYEFKVRPFGSSLYGRESNTRHIRVPEIVPGASPLAVSVAVNHEQNSTVHISWEPPPHESHNGILQGFQVWCVELEEQRYQNWTVDSGRHSLDIVTVTPGKQYWVSVAAVNGAGVGMRSDPHEFAIDSKVGSAIKAGSKKWSELATFLDPVLIGLMCALLWCVLMVVTICLWRRCSRKGHLVPGHSKGLRRLASEDLIIRHRMASPDSPWISGVWRPGHFNEKYQDLWVQNQEQSTLKSTSLPVTTKREHGSLDSSVPVVVDSCGVYGTFYVDLVGNGLKTFNSPGRRPKLPHGPSQQLGAETVQIFTQPAAKSSSLGSCEALMWKQAIRPQPKMGVLSERNHSKQELHAVNSVPVISARSQAVPANIYSPRMSHMPASRLDSVRPGGCPRLLHYSASLHLMDMLSASPPKRFDDSTDAQSFTSDEGSSHSTKLTMDSGSLKSMCGAGYGGHPGPTHPNISYPPYSHMSTASCSDSLNEERDPTLTSQEVTHYLELSPKPERHSCPSDQCPALSRPLSPSLGYLHGTLHTTHLEDDALADEVQLVGLHRARLQSTPSSCYSEWDGSLWNTWSSVMDGNMTSARTSLISSVDSNDTTDSANFARFLAVAADTISGASLSDFSPPASPLSALYPAFHSDCDSFGEVDPAPAWDWNMAWVEQMEALYKARHPSRCARHFNA